jgi:hypothetical protein
VFEGLLGAFFNWSLFSIDAADARYIIRGPIPAAPDHVRRDVYDELWRRGREPASLVALVGLGGVG